MLVGTITIDTCHGEAKIPVELLGDGPRMGTVWVRALHGLQPFTKNSHGGPYQDDTLVLPFLHVRDVHLEKDAEAEEIVETMEEQVTPPVPAPDWFLESAYEDRTCCE